MLRSEVILRSFAALSTAGRSGNRAAFSLDTFFWRRKRKYLAFGCENPIKNRRISDTKTKYTLSA